MFKAGRTSSAVFIDGHESGTCSKAARLWQGSIRSMAVGGKLGIALE